MDMLALLRAKIPDFAGYDDQEDRRRSDELVRSYLGEALSTLEARTSPDGSDPRFEPVLLRAGFMNQAVFKTFEYARLDRARVDAVGANDVRMLDLADRAATLEPAQIDGYLAEVAAAFDSRDRGMEMTPA